MSFEERKGFLPRLAEDGSWHLVSRGDFNILGQQVAASLESEQVTEASDNADVLLTTTFNSSIAGDEVFTELTKRSIVSQLPLKEQLKYLLMYSSIMQQNQ